MGYRLSVDLGTTNTAAVISRPDTAPTVVSLGDRSATMPSVLFLGPDGTMLMGEAAERRATTDPDGVVRRFKRRIGDETPLLIGAAGDGLPAHAIAARMIALVADRVAQQEGGAPDAVAVTVPAAWGAHKKELLAGALTREGLLDVTMVSEPAAAALAYAQTGRLGAGTTVAVYDLGGGTFDAALLRAETDGTFTPLGSPSGIPNLGGVDFDDAVLAYALGIAGPQTPGVDVDDPLHLTALARLRRECVEAKEGLSADTAVTIPVLLGGAQTSVRLTRGEFEAMIAGAVEETCTAVEAALVSAGLTRKNLDRILLAGGSSRIPLVTQLLSARYPGVALERDIDPKLAVAIGGVLALEQTVGPLPAAVPGAAPAVPVPMTVAAVTAAAAAPTTGATAPAAGVAASASGAGVAASVAGVKPARPVLALETFDGGVERERGRPVAVVPPRRKAPKVLMTTASVLLLGGVALTNFAPLDLGDAIRSGTLQEARADSTDDSTQLEIEAVENAKTKAKHKAAAAASAAESDSTSSTESSGSSAGTAGGHTEGSADTRSAESSDSSASDSSSDFSGSSESAGARESDASTTEGASERKAAKSTKTADRKGARAERPQAAADTTAPAAKPVDAVAAPSAVESPAAPAAPAPAPAAVEEDTTTESGSVEFNDAAEPPAAP